MGDMDRRLALTQITRISDGAGGNSEAWATVATVWAEKVALRATERFAADVTQNPVTAKFRIRYRSGVVPTMRAVVDGVTYHIHGVEEVGRREYLLLNCETVTNG